MQSLQASLELFDTPRRQLKTVDEYCYRAGAKLTEMMPMATVHEIRSSIFPATNYPHVPGKRIVAGGSTNSTQRPVRVDFTNELGEPAGHLLVTGLRRERHRRLLDYVMAYCPPIPLGDGSVGFLVERHSASRAALGDAYRHARLFELAEELQQVQLMFFKDDFAEPEMSPLCTLWLPEYEPGDPRNATLDEAIRIREFNPLTFRGYAFIALGRTYMQRLASELTIAYKPALPLIFKMSPVAANLTRLAMTHQYIRGTLLETVLDAIRAPTGAARRRDVEQLLGEDHGLLRQVGIVVKPLASTGQLAVFYEPKGTMSLTRRGLRQPAGLADC